MIRDVKPDRMLIPSPERNWDRIGAGHPDHLAAGEAAIRAVYPASRNPFAFPELLADEGLEPWTVGEVWVMAHPVTDTFVDITDTFDRKLAALRAHVSQTAHNGDLEKMLRHWGGLAAERGAGRRPAGGGVQAGHDRLTRR